MRRDLAMDADLSSLSKGDAPATVILAMIHRRPKRVFTHMRVSVETNLSCYVSM